MNADFPRSVSPTTKRLFFALSPDAATRALLAGVARATCADARPTPTDNLHMTLLFLGAVASPTAARLCSAIEALGTIPIPSFDLHLDHVGVWDRAAVRWLAPATTPHALSALVQLLGRVCNDIGVRYDRRPYRPHVTLARNVKGMSAVNRVNPILPAIEPPIVWRVADFALIRSRAGADGVEYVLQRRWPLSDIALPSP